MLLKYAVTSKIFFDEMKDKAVERYIDKKAVGLLEYALLALLVVGMFALVATLFRDRISGLIEKIKTSLNSSTTGGGNTGL